MQMLCVVLSVTNQIGNIGSFSPYIRSPECYNSVCKPVLSLANDDASYRFHYSILAFTVSVVLMSMDTYRHRSRGGKA